MDSDFPDCFDCADQLDRQFGRNSLGGWRTNRMFLCSTCGNKRCPKATNHRLDCTNSNEPGQAGSSY